MRLHNDRRWAPRHELVARNVAEATDPPSVPRSQARAIDENEAVRFLKVADGTRWGSFFRLALGILARRGELCALRWEDVCIPEVGEATVTIRRAFVEPKGNGGRVVEKSTKIERVRRIPLGLSRLALDALHQQWARQARERAEAREIYADSGHVFQHALGGPVAPDFAPKAFIRLRKRAKVRAKLHDLRHTGATWLLADGVDIATVARLLGHSTPSTTLAIYAHVLPAAESKALARIDVRLKRASEA